MVDKTDVEEAGRVALLALETEETVEPTASDAEKIAERARKKARLVQVMDKGFLQTRLAEANKIADGWVGLWVRDTNEDVARMDALGAELVTDDKIGGLHGAGDGRKRVGDLILMRMPQDDYELIQEVRSEQRLARLARGRKEYVNQFKDGKGGGLSSTVDESIRHS